MVEEISGKVVEEQIPVGPEKEEVIQPSTGKLIAAIIVFVICCIFFVWAVGNKVGWW